MARTVPVGRRNLLSDRRRVAVSLLGVGLATFRRAFAGGKLEDYVVISLIVIALPAALLVAGRIVFVSARAQRRVRRS